MLQVAPTGSTAQILQKLTSRSRKEDAPGLKIRRGHGNNDSGINQKLQFGMILLGVNVIIVGEFSCCDTYIII